MTADEQSAGRGRQGRSWAAPRGRALLCSLVIRQPRELLSLAAGAAVAELAGAVVAERPGPAVAERSDGAVAEHADGAMTKPTNAELASPLSPRATIKWPNDVLVDGRKVAGILIEGRPLEGWAALGIGINVAVRQSDLPPELQSRAGSLGLEPGAIEPLLGRLTETLDRWLATPDDAILEAVRARDALLDQPVVWAGGRGRGAGIDDRGRLRVDAPGGSVITVNAGEVHLGS